VVTFPGRSPGKRKRDTRKTGRDDHTREVSFEWQNRTREHFPSPVFPIDAARFLAWRGTFPHPKNKSVMSPDFPVCRPENPLKCPDLIVIFNFILWGLLGKILPYSPPIFAPKHG
jgi:hypothetical protein